MRPSRPPLLPQLAMAGVCLAGLATSLTGFFLIPRVPPFGLVIVAWGAAAIVLQLLAWFRPVPDRALHINVILISTLFLITLFFCVIVWIFSPYAYLLLPLMAGLFLAMVANSKWEKFHTLRTNTRHLCPHCHYDLRATPDPAGPLLLQCPECGKFASPRH